jgi:hypothetical protein
VDPAAVDDHLQQVDRRAVEHYSQALGLAVEGLGHGHLQGDRGRFDHLEHQLGRDVEGVGVVGGHRP